MSTFQELSAPTVPPDVSQAVVARRCLERAVWAAVQAYVKSTGDIVEGIDVTAEGVWARTRTPNEIDIAMGWA